MIATKIKEIRFFCETNSDPTIIEKYQKYFKEGYDGFGIDDKLFKCQIETWIKQWENEMTIDNFLNLGDALMKNGRFEEKHIAISFLKSCRKDYSKETFNRVGNWFDYGINNWATTDVLCMLILSSLLFDKIIDLNDLKKWTTAKSVWKRRAIPVALVELNKLTKDLKPADALELVETLMLDDSEYVQKGIGTLLRELWKKYPADIEVFLMKWKDNCGRLIIQYSTEKMDKEYKKKFKKRKT